LAVAVLPFVLVEARCGCAGRGLRGPLFCGASAAARRRPMSQKAMAATTASPAIPSSSVVAF